MFNATTPLTEHNPATLIRQQRDVAGQWNAEHAFTAQLESAANAQATTSDAAIDLAGQAGEARRAQQAELREAAEQLVSSVFFLPMLQQMRDDPFRTDLFHGGTGEDLFGHHLDTMLADEITTASRLPLTETIYQKMAQGVGRGSQEMSTKARSLDLHG